MTENLFNWAETKTDHEIELAQAAATKKRNIPTPLPVKLIREALEIDETVPSGLRWKVRPLHHFKTERAWKTFNTRDAGRPAGVRKGDTIYFGVGIDGGVYYSHRIIYLLIYGVDPGEKSVDHIQPNSTLPNVAKNLRLALHCENLRNQKRHSDNTSGTTGVRLHKKAGKWEAYIGVNYKHISLGLFANIADAVAARKSAEVKYFGGFSCEASRNQS